MVWKDHTFILQLIYKTPINLKYRRPVENTEFTTRCKPKNEAPISHTGTANWYHCVGMNKMGHKLEGAHRLLVNQECRCALGGLVIQ